eukprot:jgi/Bigna1/91471/estExt_fgenesh1_pg.C_1020020
MSAEQTMQKRRFREGAQDGKLYVSLMWNDITDLALHVTAPSGETICWTNMKSECGGWQDVDMNVTGESTEPVENVFWNNPPNGDYIVHVLNYRTHTNSTFTNPNRTVNFRVTVKYQDLSESFAGSVKPKERQIAFRFTHGGNNIVAFDGRRIPDDVASSRLLARDTSKGFFLHLSPGKKYTSRKSHVSSVDSLHKALRKKTTKKKTALSRKTQKASVKSSKRKEKSQKLSTVMDKCFRAKRNQARRARMNRYRKLVCWNAVKGLSQKTPKWYFDTPTGERKSMRLVAIRNAKRKEAEMSGVDASTVSKCYDHSGCTMEEECEHNSSLASSDPLTIKEKAMSNENNMAAERNRQKEIFSQVFLGHSESEQFKSIPKTPRLAERAMKKIFDCYTPKNDEERVISRNGFKKALTSLGRRPKASLLNEVFTSLDHDRNGKIDFDEFSLAFSQLQK